MNLSKGDLFAVVGISHPEFGVEEGSMMRALALSNYALGAGKILRLIEQSGDLLACQVEYSGDLMGSTSGMAELARAICRGSSAVRLMLCSKDLELWPVEEEFLKALMPAMPPASASSFPSFGVPSTLFNTQS